MKNNKTYIMLIFTFFIMLLINISVSAESGLYEIKYYDNIGVGKDTTENLKDYITPVPENASLGNLKFTSSNPSIASVGYDTGIVTGNSYGCAMIYVNSIEGISEIITIYVGHPRSGSELEFIPQRWYPNNIRLNRNCYAYAFNLVNNDLLLDAQLNSYRYLTPGQVYNSYIASKIYSGSFRNECSIVDDREYFIENVRYDIRAMKNYSTDAEVLRCLDWADDLNVIGDPNNFEEPCKPGTYKVVLVASDDGDFHWYRQDFSCLWSHKMGDDYPTNLDSDGELIYDPRYCAKTYGSTTYKYKGCFEAEAWQ